MQLKAVIVVDPAEADVSCGRVAPVLTALEQVANRPIIQHALDRLSAAGVGGAVLLGEADSLIEVRACLADYDAWQGEIEYAVRRDGPTFASTLKAVAPFVGDSACVIQSADGLLEDPVASLVGHIDSGDPGLVVFATGRGRASSEDRFAPQPHSLSAELWQETELGLFSQGAVRRARELVDVSAGGLPLSLALSRALSVRVQDVSGWHRYRGDRQDLLDLNRVALDRLEHSVPPEFARVNRLEGPLSLHPSASIRDSVIVGPAVIGPDAIVHNAYIGPWTAIGAGAHVEGAEIERSIVSARASVTHVGGRLVASLVGRDARVFRDFSLPRALRLWVGDGDEVALC